MKKLIIIALCIVLAALAACSGPPVPEAAGAEGGSADGGSAPAAPSEFPNGGGDAPEDPQGGGSEPFDGTAAPAFEAQYVRTDGYHENIGYPVVTVRPGAVDTGMLPASTAALERFCRTTELYPVNAARFREIVERVEAKKVPPEKLARVVLRALSAKKPKLVYTLNRNPALRLLDLLPRRLQLSVIRRVLTKSARK